MPAYVALIFADAREASYLREVAEAIRTLAGNQFKRAESSAAGATAVAFVSHAEPELITRTLRQLWRSGQCVWVLPLDSEPGPLLIDDALMQWVDRARPT